ARNRPSPARTTSHAPTSPPDRLAPSRNASTRPLLAPSSRRKPHPAVNEPGTSATALVALAATGETPAARSVGKVSTVPPPASAFITPATTDVTRRKTR